MDKNKIKKHIKTKIEELNTIIYKLKKYLEPIEPSESIGRVSRMEAIQSQSVSKKSLENALNELNLLELTLKRIDNTNFGFCIICEEEIAYNRLLALPQVVKCIHCESQKTSKL